MPKITIINSGFLANKGDAGILYGAITALNRYFPDNTEYIIESAWKKNIDEDIFKYLDNKIKIFNPLWKYSTVLAFKTKFFPIPNFFLVEGLVNIPILLEMRKNNRVRYLRYFLSMDDMELIDHMTDSDIIISCAGGSFHDNEGGSAFLQLLYTLCIAIDTNVPVMIYAQSIGPFKNKFYEKITRNIFNKLSLITVRDYYSKEYLEKMGVNTPIIVTADAAFSLPDPFKTEYDKSISEYLKKYYWIEGSKLNIGITVRNWNLKHSQIEIYRNVMINLIEYVCKTYEDVSITFFPQVLSDISLSKSICNCSNYYGQKCFVIEDDLHPMVLKGLYGKMNLFIGTRMHSTIFSLGMRVPTISIAYMPKSIDLMKRLNMKNVTFSIDDMSEKKVIHAVEMILQDENKMKDEIEKNIQDIEYLSIKNAEYAYKISRNKHQEFATIFQK